MGFHVACSGAALLHRLRADPGGFLGEPYSLYFLALATELDDEALAWLHKYEMQLDSLCGPYAAFFLFYSLLYEITAMKLGWWSFPGEYIGLVTILETFPIEEFIFWILLFAMAVLTFFEYTEDDEK